MKPRVVSKRERVLFPIVAFIVCTFIAPGGLPLIGMLLLGNIIKESGVTDRLSKTASNALIDIVTVLIGITVGASTSAQTFLTAASYNGQHFLDRKILKKSVFHRSMSSHAGSPLFPNLEISL